MLSTKNFEKMIRYSELICRGEALYCLSVFAVTRLIVPCSYTVYLEKVKNDRLERTKIVRNWDITQR